MKIINPATGAVIADVAADNAAAVRRKYERARARRSPRWAAVPIAQAARRDRAFPRADRRDARDARPHADARGRQADPPVAQRAERPARRGSTSSSPSRRRALREREGASPTPGRSSRSGSRTSRSASSPTSRRGTTRTSSAATCSCRRSSPATRSLYKPSEFATLTGLHIAEMLHEAGVPDDVFVPVDRRRRDRRRAAAPAGRRRVLHRLLRDRREDRRERRPADDQGRSSSSAARTRSTSATTSTSRPRPPASPTARSTTPASRAARSSASTCTSRSTTPSSTAFVAEVKGYRIGDPMDEATYIGAITRRPQLDVLKAQVADAKKKGAKLLLRRPRRSRARATGSSRRCSPTSTTRWR